jgi:hypothetical protein
VGIRTRPPLPPPLALTPANGGHSLPPSAIAVSPWRPTAFDRDTPCPTIRIVGQRAPLPPCPYRRVRASARPPSTPSASPKRRHPELVEGSLSCRAARFLRPHPCERWPSSSSVWSSKRASTTRPLSTAGELHESELTGEPRLRARAGGPAVLVIAGDGRPSSGHRLR